MKQLGKQVPNLMMQTQIPLCPVRVLLSNEMQLQHCSYSPLHLLFWDCKMVWLVGFFSQTTVLLSHFCCHGDSESKEHTAHV